MKRALLIIAVLPIALTPAACESSPRNRITISQNANGSSGEHWEYELSCDNVLREVKYQTHRSPLNFGPGYEEQWIFEAVAEGEVTIRWTAYEGGEHIMEDKCYSAVYNVDADGNITCISSAADGYTDIY